MNGRIVVFHDGCKDGWTAAWVCALKFGQEGLEATVEYLLPAKYGDPPPDVRGKDVTIVDFSYPRDVLEHMHKEATSLVVLDHHRTAQEALAGLSYAHFDMNRSGAGMAWDYFFPDKPRPWLVDYVEDHDLWRFALPNSKEINACIAAYMSDDFADWDELHCTPLETVIERGRAVEKFINRYVREMAAQQLRARFEGYDVPIVNAPYLNISELVGELSKGHPFAMGWFQRADGKYQYSLRSRMPEGIDVSELAKKYGGGGHKHAAGFTLEMPLVTHVP